MSDENEKATGCCASACCTPEVGKALAELLRAFAKSVESCCQKA